MFSIRGSVYQVLNRGDQLYCMSQGQRKFRSVTARQGEVLRLLSRSQFGSLGEIAAALGVNSAAAVKMVSRLEGKGLVRRRTDDWDRRLTRVSLTDAGREAVRLFGSIQQSDKSK